MNKIVTSRSKVLGSLSCSNGDLNTIHMIILIFAMFLYYFIHFFMQSITRPNDLSNINIYILMNKLKKGLQKMNGRSRKNLKKKNYGE